MSKHQSGENGFRTGEMVSALPASFAVTLSMITDWHAGTGSGRPGDVDRLVRRDADGMPFVPAKTLTGIWRDACEAVAFGLDDGKEGGAWGKWVLRLFGEQPALAKPGQTPANAPDPAALSVRAARLPEALRGALRSKPKLTPAVTFVKPGVSIDPATGRARDGFLRFEEMARAGATLRALCNLRLDSSEEEKAAAAALLVCGARMVERLGAKRRRGAGRCLMAIEGIDAVEPWVKWIEEHPEVPPPSEPSPSALDVMEDDRVSAAPGDWYHIGLTVVAKSPLLAQSRTVGNTVESLDFLPGTYLLPIVTDALSAAGVDARAAIGRGDLIVTNATMELNGVPGRAVPRALYQEKGGGHSGEVCVFNRLKEAAPGGKQLRALRSGYVGAAPPDLLPTFIIPPLETIAHNVVQDEVQRPTGDVGGVYSYQAIPEGTRLKAELRLRKQLLDALTERDREWLNRLEGTHKVGRAKKDDYGAVSLTVSAPPSMSPPRRDGVSSELTVWLLSHVLLRDERLRPSASVELFGRVLGHALGVTLKVRPAPGELMSVAAQRQRTDSWNVGWGLPRPTLAGLVNGTCVAFICEGTVSAERLAEVESGGIGERRAEGFGQISFNDPLVASPASGRPLALRLLEPVVNMEVIVREGDPAFAYARIIEREAWRQEISRASLRVAAAGGGRKAVLGVEVSKKGAPSAGVPPMSQLGALRSVLGRLRDKSHRDVVISWLHHLEKTKNRREKWSENSLRAVRTLIEEPEAVWRLLGIETAELIVTEGGQDVLKEELWAEAVRALVEACVRAHKRELEAV